MSKNTIKRSSKIQFDSFRSLLKQNKRTLLIGLCFVGAGLLFALIGIKKYNSEHEINCIFALIKCGDFSFVKFNLLLLIFLCVPVGVLFILSANYFLFMLAFPSISVISFLFFRYVFATFACGFVAAFISFLLVLLPIFCIFYMSIVFFIAKTCDLIAYRPCNKIIYFTPYRAYFETMKKYLMLYLLTCVIPCFVYANIVAVISYLILGA